jgi:tetratricopeptide (TPR) repeat protein
VAQLVSRGLVILRALALLLLAAVTADSLIRWTWRPLQCVHEASLGAAALDAGVRQDEYETRRLAARIRADLNDCEHVSAPEIAIPFARGAAAELAGDPHAAIAEYERALRIDRRPELYFRLGMARLAALERSAAIDSFTRACAFDPTMLADIPYEDIRRETRQRLRATYPADWIDAANGTER